MTLSSLHSRFLAVCIVVAFIPSIGGCVWGPKVEEHIPATSGEGLASIINLRSASRESEAVTIRGELLEVRPTGIVILSRPQPKLVYVAFAAIKSAEFPTDRRAAIGRRGADRSMRERLRLQSRFPQGMTDEVVGDLLEIYGQEDIETTDLE